eukprot:7378910-Prymnesium_polylepis.1
MDDNRILTLANNDRIPMLRPNVTLHFEVEDLRNASPATVSRAGIIYISDADLGWEPMVKSWVDKRTKDGATIQVYIDKFVPFMLDFTRKELKPKMTIAEISLMQSLTTLIDSMLKDMADPPSESGMERFVIYALIWSLAGVLESSDRAKVDKALRTLTNNLPEVEAPDTVFEYRIDVGNECTWANWGAIIPKWEYSGDSLAKEFPSLLIPTIDSVRTEYNISLSIAMNRTLPGFEPWLLGSHPLNSTTRVPIDVRQGPSCSSAGRALPRRRSSCR